MAVFRPDINPDILRWAREWAGYSLDEVAEKEASYPMWENGTKLPTMKQLEKIAHRFHIPFGYFFLPQPPNIEVPIPDFRTHENQHPVRPSPDLLDVAHQMIRRQDWMRNFLVEEGEEPLDFVGSVKPHEPINDVATKIRNTLGLAPLWAGAQKSQEDALRFLREAAENQRIMVAIMGYAGTSTHRTLDVNEFRGFVLSDTFAPLIFINGRDAKQGQMFTLAHELVHIWLDQDALVDLPQLMPANTDTEIFCNRVAAEILVPADEFYRAWEDAQLHPTPFQVVARQFKVSQIVVARKALDLGVMTREDFFDFYEHWTSEAAGAHKQSSGGNFWNTQGTRIGKLFGGAVVRAVKQGKLLYTDAYEMTGLRSNALNTFADRLGLSL